jgi:hypothetical protein
MSLLDDLTAAENPKLSTDLNLWVRRHNAVVWEFCNGEPHKAMLTPAERGILAIADGITVYLDQDVDWTNESFLDQYVAGLIEGFRGLLDGDTGSRLDSGTLDAWALKMAARIGWDMDTDERTGVSNNG